jgi:hypothetical protein
MFFSSPLKLVQRRHEIEKAAAIRAIDARTLQATPQIGAFSAKNACQPGSSVI